MKSGGDGLTNCPRCGLDISGDRTPRSHRFLHAIIAAAFANWPERHNHRPADCDHLRAWLFCHPRVEFCGTIEGPPSAAAQFEDVARALRERGDRFFFAGTEAADIVLRVPRTAVYASKGGPKRGAFYALCSRVLAVIEEETGISREDLRREGLAAVAPPRRLGARRAA
jgi:hypothetical protein